MGERQHTNDPLSRALDETRDVADDARSPEVVERKVRSHPVGEVLQELQAGALEAVSGTFFDSGAKAETNPIVKRAHVEASSVRVSARRNEPPLEAEVAIDVRCDHAQPDADVYQVRGTGRVARADDARRVEREFAVPVDVREEDGHVGLDPNAVRDRIASAIRSTGRSPDQ
jgi:hypothetical protein